MSDVLVVYFSVTGHTEALARTMAAELGADLEVIRPTDGYDGPIGALRGMWQQITGGGPGLEPGRALDGYRLVVVGSPVWGGKLAAPVRSWLRRNRDRIPALAGFWISASGQAYRGVGEEMARLGGVPLRASHAFNDPDLKSGAFGGPARAFAAALRAAPRQEPVAA